MLTSFLEPGGSLLVVDFVKDGTEGSHVTPESFGHIVPHRSGFTEDEIREVFEGAGLVEFSFSPATKGKMHGKEVTFFLARGKKL